MASANLIFLPIATKLKFLDTLEIARMEMILEGILSIQVGENLFTLKEKLKSHIGNATKENTEDASFESVTNKG